MRDRTTGKSKGYAFVTFVTYEAARTALRAGAPTIDGRQSNLSMVSFVPALCIWLDSIPWFLVIDCIYSSRFRP